MDTKNPLAGGRSAAFHAEIQQVQRQLLTERDNPFGGADLASYAASGAAAELVWHWRECNPQLEAATKAADVADVIAVLQAWQASLLGRPVDRWTHTSEAFKAEAPWCGWITAFSHGSDWDTTCFGLERMVGINVLLTTADGRSRPVNIVNWQYIASDYDSKGDCERKGGIEIVELETEHYEPIDAERREQVPYEDIREIVVF